MGLRSLRSAALRKLCGPSLSTRHVEVGEGFAFGNESLTRPQLWAVEFSCFIGTPHSNASL